MVDTGEDRARRLKRRRSQKIKTDFRRGPKKSQIESVNLEKSLNQNS